MPITLDGSPLTVEKLIAIAQNRNIRRAKERRASDVLLVYSRLIDYLVGSTTRLSRYKVS